MPRGLRWRDLPLRLRRARPPAPPTPHRLLGRRRGGRAAFGLRRPTLLRRRARGHARTRRSLRLRRACRRPTGPQPVGQRQRIPVLGLSVVRHELPCSIRARARSHCAAHEMEKSLRWTLLSAVFAARRGRSLPRGPVQWNENSVWNALALQPVQSRFGVLASMAPATCWHARQGPCWPPCAPWPRPASKPT